MCRFVVVFAWAALFALANVSAHGAVYYADSRNGDDSLDGLSAAEPLASMPGNVSTHISVPADAPTTTFVHTDTL